MGGDREGRASRPKAEPPFFVEAAAKRLRPTPAPKDLPAGTIVNKLTTAGAFMLAGIHYMVDGRLALKQVLVITDGDKITVADLDGEILSTPGPHPGSDTWATADPADRAKPLNVTDVLTHQLSPMS